MRASGVGVTAAQRPTGPAVIIRPSDAASTRRNTLLTDLGCSAATTVSNLSPCHRWRPYCKYIVGTTTMFNSVDVINPNRITIAIGV